MSLKGNISCFFSLFTGLARKEDFPFITYYCPHCHALNRPNQCEERVSGSSTPSSGSVKGVGSSDTLKTDSGSANESVVTGDSSIRPVPENKKEEVTETMADLAS